MPLDTQIDLTPRFLAMVRTPCRKAGLDDSVSDLLAAYMRGNKIPAKTAADYARELDNVMKSASAANMQTGEVVALLQEIMGDDDEDDSKDPTAFFKKVNARISPLATERMCTTMMQDEPAPTRPSAQPWTDMKDYTKGSDFHANLIDGLRARMNPMHKPTRGREFASMSFREIAQTCAQSSGGGRLNSRKALEACLNPSMSSTGHTTSDFQTILSGAVNLELAQTYQQQMPEIVQCARQLSAPDFRLRTRPRLSTGPELEKGVEHAELTYGTFEESGEYAPKVDTYRKGFRLTREALVNDNLGAFAQIPQEMARGSITTVRNVMIAPLLANSGDGQTMRDGDPVFDANHSNLAASGGAISVSTVEAATTAMRRQTGLQGEVISVVPWALLVPPEQEGSARQLVGEVIPNQVDQVNQFSKRLQVLVEPGLTNTSTWYLIANPALGDGLAYSYLDGQEGPRVEERPGWDVEGLEWKVILDFGSAFIDWRAWYKDPGS